MSITGFATPTPRHYPAATFSQVAVQNTWYTVLDTTQNIEVYYITTLMAVADETIELRITVDGTVYASDAQVHTAGTSYNLVRKVSSDGFYFVANTTILLGSYNTFKARSMKIEIRKTTAAGANTLSCGVVYSRMV